jgi:hypothetical protein
MNEKDVFYKENIFNYKTSKSVNNKPDCIDVLTGLIAEALAGVTARKKTLNKNAKTKPTNRWCKCTNIALCVDNNCRCC